MAAGQLSAPRQEILAEGERWKQQVPQFDKILASARAMTFLDPYDPGLFRPMVQAHTKIHDQIITVCQQAETVMFNVGDNLQRIAADLHDYDFASADKVKGLTIMAPEPKPRRGMQR